ncbi:co-chaperone GroES [Patescibacteria group bacterium]|jgi:chaperonin GroES|nr:co-chaperone GroES [Patescibacteria group bacterium]HPD07827.1 co-chaperone GroES [bacterium]HRT11218.1 co-chaperone GroES [Patescibacteria group bacterium]HRU90041.1 co-chaperone GroES [Patescibacteria group bacterium]
MKLQPLHDQVIIKPLTAEEKTKSGIILPDTINKDRPEQGEVIAVGPGRLLDNGQRAPMSVKVGDKVVFKKYSTEDLKLDDQEYVVVAERDILAIIN